jgi:hypothetical protein
MLSGLAKSELIGTRQSPGRGHNSSLTPTTKHEDNIPPTTVRFHRHVYVPPSCGRV